jgi:hypothetical protein
MAIITLVLLVIFLGNILGYVGNREAADVLVRTVVFYLLCRIVWNTWTQRTFYSGVAVTLLGLWLKQQAPDLGHALYIAGPAVGIAVGFISYLTDLNRTHKEKKSAFSTFKSSANQKRDETGERVLN